MKWSEIVSMTMGLLQRDSSNVSNLNTGDSLRAFANKALITIANKHKPLIAQFEIIVDDNNINKPIRMPNDFLSHNGMIHYYMAENDNRLQIAKNISFNTQFIILDKKGTYFIYYNALYPLIDKSHITEDKDINIDISVLYITSSFIAAQIIFIEDPALSQILLNKFEAEMYELDNAIYQDNEV